MPFVRMGVPMPASSEDGSNLRRFLSRGEVMTLVGMLLAVSSLFLVWKQVDSGSIGIPMPTVFSEKVFVTQRGIDMIVRWPLLLCATGACATLLTQTTAQNRMTLFIMQLTFSIAVCVMALTHFALRPGIVVALLGGGLLIIGAIDRYNAGNNSPVAP